MKTRNNLIRFAGFSGLTTLLILAGCNARAPVENSSLPGPKLPLIDDIELNNLLKQHEGRIILIDFWATWCRPCMELFSHTVEIHHRWADRGLTVIGINLDAPDNDSAVRRFIALKKADFSNYISRFGPSSQSAEAFDIEGGGIPFLKLYDANGNLIKTFGGDKPVYPEEIEQDIKAAIEKI